MREGNQIEQDHMRNRQMIVHWLMANTEAIEHRERDGKTYYVMVDAEAFRAGVATLLAEVQRIKSEGDYDAARTLFETHGIYFDPALRDEVVARVDAVGLPSYSGFVQPRLEPVLDDAGEIVDVAISYPMDLTVADAGVLGQADAVGVCAVERRGLLEGLVGRQAEPKATIGGRGWPTRPEREPAGDASRPGPISTVGTG